MQGKELVNMTPKVQSTKEIKSINYPNFEMKT